MHGEDVLHHGGRLGDPTIATLAILYMTAIYLAVILTENAKALTQ